MGRKLTKEIFIERALKVHNNFYNYEKVKYINNRTKVIIICPVHGEFSQTPTNHIEGQGCQRCGYENGAKKNTKTQEQFIKKASKIHNYKYDYIKTIYTHNKNKIIITCKKHGDFKQIAYQHTDGRGCTKCGNESHWKRSEYIKKAKERNCIFYIIKCFNKEEEFYKIGITMKTIRERYSGIKRMPYNYEIISEIYGEAGFIWDLEKEEKIKLKEFNYQPSTKFKGSKTECFTKYKL